MSLFRGYTWTYLARATLIGCSLEARAVLMNLMVGDHHAVSLGYSRWVAMVSLSSSELRSALSTLPWPSSMPQEFWGTAKKRS